MNVDQKTLDQAAARFFGVHKALFGTLRRGDLSAPAAETIEQTRAGAWYALKDLVAAGAADPRPHRPAAVGPTETPLHLLDTPKNRRLLNALVEAHQAALDVDAERGIVDGFAEVIEHFAAQVQTEIYGPADLRQSSGAKER